MNNCDKTCWNQWIYHLLDYHHQCKILSFVNKHLKMHLYFFTGIVNSHWRIVWVLNLIQIWTTFGFRYASDYQQQLVIHNHNNKKNNPNIMLHAGYWLCNNVHTKSCSLVWISLDCYVFDHGCILIWNVWIHCVDLAWISCSCLNWICWARVVL